MLNCSEPATLSILIFKLSKDSLSVYIVISPVSIASRCHFVVNGAYF